MSSRRRSVARALAYAFLDGAWNQKAMLERGSSVLGEPPIRLLGVVRRVRRRYPAPPIGRIRALTELIEGSVAVATTSNALLPSVRRFRLPVAAMARPVAPLASLDVPRLATLSDLADFFGVTHAELAWFADTQQRNARARDAALEHYVCRWQPKRTGGHRLVEAPKARLKAMQRSVLDRVLARVPLHEGCHGHRAGRSVTSAVRPHVGKEIVLAADLTDFFTSVTSSRVRAIFESLGYPDEVANALTGLCTTITPGRVLSAQPMPDSPTGLDLSRRFLQRQRLRDRHLPQGAPTSPMLANLAAFELDRRLMGLAGRHGAAYSRYADDLAFSGGAQFRRALDVFVPSIGTIALEAGFTLRADKTRAMHASQRQRFCGLVLNHAAAPPREDLERLEAILFNCVRRGPGTQNRAGVDDFRAHLLGRVAWVEHVHPRKGADLRALFAKIDWSEGPPTP